MRREEPKRSVHRRGERPPILWVAGEIATKTFGLDTQRATTSLCCPVTHVASATFCPCPRFGSTKVGEDFPRRPGAGSAARDSKRSPDTGDLLVQNKTGCAGS